MQPPAQRRCPWASCTAAAGGRALPARAGPRWSASAPTPRSASASRARSRSTSSATAAGWPCWRSPATSWSGSSRRTPTRCCCRSWPRSTASASPSSTGSTSHARAADDHATRFAQQQLIWMTLGVVLFVAAARLLRDHRVLQRVHLHLRPSRDRAAAAAAGCPASAPRSTAPGSGSARAVQLPARRGRQGAAGGRLRRLPRAAPRRARPRRPPACFVDLPRGRDLGPILAMWLVSLGILVFQRDLGSSRCCSSASSW